MDILERIDNFSLLEPEDYDLSTAVGIVFSAEEEIEKLMAENAKLRAEIAEARKECPHLGCELCAFIKNHPRVR